MRRAVAPAITTGALLAAVAAPAHAAFPGENGRIAVFSLADGTAQVRVAGLDGHGVRRIARFRPLPAHLHHQSGHAQWSPSGRRLLVQRVGSGFELRTPRGRLVRSIETSLYFPSWSPDGREIVAVDGEAVPRALVRLRPDGSRAGRIPLPLHANVTHPRWSPTGRWLLFEHGTPEGQYVWRVRPSGRGARRLAAGRLPSWSPDGRRIAFAHGPDLFTMRANGNGRTRVAAAAHRHSVIAGVSWSPDGRRIALVRQHPGTEHDASTIVTVPARGGRERRHWTVSHFMGSIDWQPRPRR